MSPPGNAARLAAGPAQLRVDRALRSLARFTGLSCCIVQDRQRTVVGSSLESMLSHCPTRQDAPGSAILWSLPPSLRHAVFSAVRLSPEPIISGMDKPDYVLGGVMRCGDCGKPVKLGVGGVSACKNPECVRNKPRVS